MFQFDDLDGMSRLLLLKKQKETVAYWKSVYRLKGAFQAWGDNTRELIDMYSGQGSDPQLKIDMEVLAVRGKTTVWKLAKHLIKIDAYLKDIDARLADGTKWYSAAEIYELFQQAEAEGLTKESAE